MKTETLIRTGMAALLAAGIITVAPFSHAARTAADATQKKVESAEQGQDAPSSRWNIWNWFGHEEHPGAKIPIQHETAKDVEEGFASHLEEFHHEIDRLFHEMFQDTDMASFDFDQPFNQHITDGTFRPSLDLSAGDKAYTVTVELPGAKKDEIKVDIVDNVMTISGEKQQEKEEKDKDQYRQERYFGEFQRVLTLPDDADQDGIQADFKQGVLTVTVPRKPMPKSKVKEIEIHS